MFVDIADQHFKGPPVPDNFLCVGWEESSKGVTDKGEGEQIFQAGQVFGEAIVSMVE